RRGPAPGGGRPRRFAAGRLPANSFATPTGAPVAGSLTSTTPAQRPLPGARAVPTFSMSIGRGTPPATGLLPRTDGREDQMLLNSRRSSRLTHRSTSVRALALLAAGAIVGGGSTACVSTVRYNPVEQDRDAQAAR